MSVYERLVVLASKPCFDDAVLTSREGDRLLSDSDVVQELKFEFGSEARRSFSVDIRQACETRVSEL